MPRTIGYAHAWGLLREAFEEIQRRGVEPIILSTLPFRTDEHHDHAAFPFVLVPSGRLIATAAGLRAALPDRMLLLIGAADSVTLGTNHLIHAARRNMGMIMLVLRSDLLASGDDALDRSGWSETGLGSGISPAGAPLDWATALKASLVARARVDDIQMVADLLMLAHERKGFSVIGLTGDASLSTGVTSTDDWPEFFSAYSQWAAPLLKDDGRFKSAPSVRPDPKAPKRVEVRIAGIGGQGVKLAGTILSEAAGLHSGLWATHYGEYGSATRGGPSKVDVVFGSERITYAGADHADVLIALSRGAVPKTVSRDQPGKWLVIDADVDVAEDLPSSTLRIPMVGIAREHTGKPMAAGVASLGCVAAFTSGITLEGLTAVVFEKLPSRIAEKNVGALTEVYELTTAQIGATV